MPPFLIRRYRASRHLRLHVRQDGTVLVTAPWRAPVAMIKTFVAAHADWIERNLARVSAHPELQRVRLSPSERERAREATRVLVAERLAHFNRVYQLTWKRVFVRNQRRAWGSCSKIGNLNFNLRLSLLPPELSDYVIVHELCHRAQFNHSSAFWALVAHTIPDFKERKRALKRHRL